MVIRLSGILYGVFVQFVQHCLNSVTPRYAQALEFDARVRQLSFCYSKLLISLSLCCQF